MIGAEANQSIMVTRRHEFGFAAGYKKTNVNTLFANSMMVLDGEEHRRARGILSPAVGRLAIRECTDAAAKIWRDSLADAAETTVDVYQLAERTSFGVASNVLNGLQMGSESDVLRPYFQRLIDGMTAPTQKRIPFGKLDRALKARKELFELLTPKVEKARTERPYGLIGQLAHYSDEDGNPLPTDEIVGHLLLLFWAGYDTTASAVSWILQTLAQRPQWQERLREERPNEFDPCRWDPSKPDYQAKISDLVGFGGGPRTCLGKAFAILQLKLMIHTVVTKYRIELEPNCEWKPMKIPVFHPVGSKIRIHRL